MPAQKTLSPSVLLAEELYRLVARSRRVMWMTAARTLEAKGQSIFPWQVLCYLARNGAMSQRDLALVTAQHPAGISRMLEELEGQELVRRSPDAQDRRKHLVEATAKGKAWVESATPDVFAAVDHILSDLSTDERQQLRALLERLLTTAEEAGPARDEAAPKAKRRTA